MTGEGLMSYALKPMLRGDDVFELGFDLDGGEAGGVPTTAECLDEKDRGNEALALDDGGGLTGISVGPFLPAL